MQLSIGIVGLPNVGKSTLFNALTKKSVPAENYPFCTIDPSVGIVPVPDARLDRLAEMSNSAKKLPAVIEFVDIAGLVAGASKGEGLGNKFLANIREVDAILHMVRTFEDASVTHVGGRVDPLSDIAIITMELVLTDLETVNKRLGTIEKEVKRHNKEAMYEKGVLEKVQQALENEQLAHTLELLDEERAVINNLHLLTMKPMLYGLNTSEANNNVTVEVPGPHVAIDPVFEHGFTELIQACYDLLGLETFFTTGPEESRAWTIEKESTAPEAGATIHTDFRDKFIRAEVINWQELLDAGSHAKAREQGLLRLEGKDYIVQDGDVIEFKI